MLQDGTFPSFQKSERDIKTNFVSDATKVILCADSREELDMIIDMRIFNCRGNQE